jgi:gliding motility-associated protein GldM
MQTKKEEETMATQNLSPRQKMINMMYLVLLAILALNVSSEALDAFLTFRDRLSVSAMDANQTNVDYITQLKKAIDKEVSVENKTVNVGLKDTLDQIRSRTQSIVAILGAHAHQMEEIGGFDPTTGSFKRFDELEENYRYWMGRDEDANDRRGNGAAMPLRDSLDAYFAYLNRINNHIAPDSMAQESHQLVDPEPSEADPNKRWEQYTFQGPVIANLGVLESIKLEVYQEEKRLLDLLESRLGGYIYAPDKVVAISSPTARIVPAGMQFETQLFVGMASSQMKPLFLSSNGRVELTDDGNRATLKINADGSRIPSGKKEYRQNYTATIRVPKLDGTFEELQINESFMVRKPEVVLTSTAVQNLYRNCANTVNIDVPALGEQYNPVVSASNATVQTSERSKTRFLIDPQAGPVQSRSSPEPTGS